MTMSMISSIAPDDFRNDEDVFVNPIFEAECTWNEREFELASWGFAKWRQHQVGLQHPRKNFKTASLIFLVHLLERRSLGKCRFPEGSQRNLGRVEEKGPVPICASYKHSLFTVASW